MRTVFSAPELNEQSARALLAIAREALTNVQRHAQATQVSLELTAQGLEIKDDGVGFGDDVDTRGIGLFGMRERARAIGAELKLENGPGASVRVELP